MSLIPIALANNLADAIRANVPIMALLRGPNQPAEVENAIRQLAEDQIGFVRVCNPLVSPLSLERLMFQITGDEAGEGRQDNIESVRRALIARSTMLRQIVVVVEQAETLAPEALEFLHDLPGLSHPSLAPVQVALVGSLALGARLADNRTYIIRDPADPVLASAVPVPTPAPRETWPAVAREGRPRSKKLLLASLVLFGAGGILLMVYGAFEADTVPLAPTPFPTLTPAVRQAPSPTIASEPQQTATAAPQPLPVAPPVQPAVQPLADTTPASEQASPQLSQVEPPIPEPPIPPSVQAANDRARLYREFTAFLDTSVLRKRLSQTERKALLQEYLARHQTTLSGSQTAGSIARPTETEALRIPGEPHVLLFFASGSNPDFTAAEHLGELLRSRVAGFDLQPVAAVPEIPTIRYEFPADRTAALALAQTTRAPDGAWQVEDMTASPKRPEPGTIEMWLPRR